MNNWVIYKCVLLFPIIKIQLQDLSVYDQPTLVKIMYLLSMHTMTLHRSNDDDDDRKSHDKIDVEKVTFPPTNKCEKAFNI